MTATIKPEVQAIIDRCAAIDWPRPPHDRARAEAAYERRLKVSGLRRRVRWIEDPADSDAWDIGTGRAAKAGGSDQGRRSRTRSQRRSALGRRGSPACPATCNSKRGLGPLGCFDR